MSEPTIHFARRSDAAERVEMGPAWCNAGRASRTEFEQYVTAIFDHVTCKNCLRSARAYLERVDPSPVGWEEG
jgi:hypothetical protein